MPPEDESLPIPQYQCHKIVQAFKVGKIEGFRIFSYDDERIFVDVDLEYINRTNLNREGYFVQYEDGYRSWSPAKAFEEGYTLLNCLSGSCTPIVD